MKGKLILLTIALVLILLSFGLCANADVKYLGTDTKTQGDWIGVYGQDGAKETHAVDVPDPYKPDEAQKLFKKGLIKEISVTDAGTLNGPKAYGWIFNANPGDNKKAPWLVDKSARYAACVSGRATNMAMTLTVNSSSYKVTVYSLDFDTTARNCQVYGYQGKDLPDDPDDTIAKYTDGVYTSWEVTGTDPFKYFAKNGAGSVNCVSSAIFVDSTASVDPNGKLSTLWGSIKNTP
jgi:hypothetical protein